MTRFSEPMVAWAAPDDPARPLVVLLHGRGAAETGIIGLADHLADGPSYAAVSRWRMSSIDPASRK